MDSLPFEALETKINLVLDRLKTLQTEKNELQKQVEIWQSRCQEAEERLDELTRERDALAQNQRNPEQEELIRTRITALLAKLEAA